MTHWDILHPLCTQPRFCYKSSGDINYREITKSQNRICHNGKGGSKGCRKSLLLIFQGVIGTSLWRNRQSYSCTTLLRYLEAAITYLPFADEQGAVHCSLVMGRTRNALVKELKVPRSEVKAAVLTTRLNKMILREVELPIDKVFMWSDSKTVLQYIANQTKRFHTFVSNRVA